MLRAMRTKGILLTLVTAGCAGSATPATPSTPASSAPVPALSASRELPRGASYGELVAALDLEDSLTPSAARCLLAKSGEAYRFEGTSSVALHPLPATAEELDMLMHGSTARVLTRHGSYGAAQASLGFVALSEAPPTRGAALVVITDRALYARTLDGAEPRVVNELASLPAQLRELAPGATAYVTAESAVPVARVYDVLHALSALDAPVVLAMALPPEVTLPAPPAPSQRAPRCPDGLAATDAAEGDLPVAALQEGIAPLRERAPDCLRRAEGPGAAGGRLTIALRIDATGKVGDACLVASDAEDDALASCLLGLSRELRFPAPSPGGVVDAELPLVLKPETSGLQKPVCEP